MVTSIQLGNISQQNGKTVVTGNSSGGLDTEKLIEELTTAKRLPAVQLEERIESNVEKSGAFQELENILVRFQDAANFLRNPPGVNNDADNIFEYRNALLSGTSGGLAANNFLSVTAVPGASVSNYDIEIDQLATQNTKVTETFALADADTQAVGGGGPFNAGTLTLGADGIDIELEDGDSLNQVVAKINAVTQLSDVEANVIKVSEGNFRLSLKTVTTGTVSNYDLGEPVVPEFVTNDAIFRLAADDVNGDGDTANNPADGALAAPSDTTGNTTLTAQGGTPNLANGGGDNTRAVIDFAGVNGAYQVGNTADINTNGPYDQKTFAFAIETGADVSGVQTIYEQGGGSRNFGVYIAPDPGNGGAATLFAVAYNDQEWAAGEQTKVVNLGTVNPNENYNIRVEFDASANPGATDPANTFTGFVNGVQMDQVGNLQEMNAHTGDVAIGGILNSATLPDGTIAANGNYFEGKVSEVALFNRTLNNSEAAQLDTYFDKKYSQPITNNGIFNVGFAVLEDAVDSQFTVDGTAVTRSTNSVDDVIDGLTFNLLSETSPGDDVQVKIEPDTELAKNAIFSFADAYNEFRIFAAKQRELEEDGTPTESSLLAGNSTLRSIISRVNTEIASVVEGITAGNPDRLADIGVNFGDFPGDEETPFVRNIISIDEQQLEASLQADYQAVRRIFEFDFTSDDPNLTVFQRTKTLGISNFELNVDQTNGIYQATYEDSTGAMVTIDLDAEPLAGGSGVVLSGRAESVLDGLTLLYTDTDDQTVNVNISQGVGDRVFNTLDNILEEDNGALSLELETLSDTNDRLQREIDRIDEQIEGYRSQLLRQFSALEQAIAQANTLLQSLAAQSSAREAAG